MARERISNFAVHIAGTFRFDVSDYQVMGLQVLIVVGPAFSFQYAIAIASVISMDLHERVDSAAVFNIVQIGGTPSFQAIGGTIFKNVGRYGVTAEKLIAQLSLLVWEARDPDITPDRAATYVTTVIVRESYLVAVGGAICLGCGPAAC
jgi:hypothetical protein